LNKSLVYRHKLKAVNYRHLMKYFHKLFQILRNNFKVRVYSYNFNADYF